MYFIVTDLWFDPVAGENDETAGRMVALKHLDQSGNAFGGKRAHTLRGLASQRYQYAQIDFIGQRKAAAEAQEEGKVITIEKGKKIRRRPKLPTNRL